METEYHSEGSRKNGVPVESEKANIKIKTLDSHSYDFQVDKNISVLAFKKEIANKISVPVGQQRLIFQGKVLKDECALSEYKVENGHTVHLVMRQPADVNVSSDSTFGERNQNSTDRGTGDESSGGAPRSRTGQISHSVLLGTFNIGDQGDAAAVPDVSRVIGAVLNSIGIGPQAAANGVGAVQVSSVPDMNAQPPHGHEAGATSQPFQSIPYVVQPSGTAPVPSLVVPIPDSLSTITEFILNMQHALSQSAADAGNSQSSPPNIPEDQPTIDIPVDARGLPTLDALHVVLRLVERFFSSHLINTLSHFTGRFEKEAASTDVAVREEVQAESVRVGMAMLHSGSLLLEVGRTMLTLCMAQSPEASSLNTGPAVYISPLGPNPLMVQPFPFQVSSLFTGSAPTSGAANFTPVAVGNAPPRLVNIHIHAVGPRPSNAEGGQVGQDDGSVAGQVQSRSSMRNIIAGAIPRPHSTSGAAPVRGLSSSQPPSDSVQLPHPDMTQNLQNGSPPGSAVSGSDVVPSNETKNLPINNQVGESSASSPQLPLPSCVGTEADGTASSSSNRKSAVPIAEIAANCNEKLDSGGAKTVPLGLGLGNLERKKKNDVGNVSQTESGANRTDNNGHHEQAFGGEVDVSGIVSHVLNNPVMDGLFSRISEQTGVGSPNILRNMFQQLSQNPQVMGTVGQIAQQVGTGSHGGPDLASDMVQRLIPTISQVLGGGSGVNVPPSSSSSRDSATDQQRNNDQNAQEHRDP